MTTEVRPPFMVPPPAPRSIIPSAARWPMLVVGGSILAGLGMRESPLIATLHFGVTLLVALWAAFLSPRVETAAYAAGYAAGCDVLWRMTNAKAPWEASKYLVVLICVAALIRHVRRPRKMGVPIALIVVLIPGAIIAFVKLGPTLARDQISFLLMGLVALAAGVAFFRQLVATPTELSRLLWMVAAPTMSIAAIATQGTLAAGNLLKFNGESNFETSGGYGPNQVSLVVGFGALLCLLLVLMRAPLHERIVAVATGGWLVGVAFLSFSRGGIYSFALGVAALALVGLFSRGGRSRAFASVIVVLVGAVVVFTWVNSFTGGALDLRYNDTGSTNRNVIASRDLDEFFAHPILGGGVGAARLSGFSQGKIESLSHTEYARLLGEHGMLGIAEIGLLFAVAITAIRRSTTSWNRMMAAALCIWSLSAMAHAGTRVALVGFGLGLACLRLQPDARKT